MGLLAKAISFKVITGSSGGLSRKLTVCAQELPTARNAAPVLRARGRSPGGLLRRSLLFLDLEREEAPQRESLIIVDYADNIERLRARIEKLALDFSFFPNLHLLLVRELNLPQSALFLYGYFRNAYVPWLHRGLDARLAAALSFTEKHWLDVLKRPLDRPLRLENGERLFPSLPRALPKPLFMFPFFHRNEFQGSLMVGNLPVKPEGQASLFELFDTLSGKIGRAIDSVLQGLRELPRPEYFFPTPAQALPALLEPGSGRADTFRVTVFSLAPLLRRLGERFALFDKQRFREILIYIVNSHLASLGAGTPCGAEDVLLVTRAAPCYSPQLLAAWLTDVVRDSFRGLFPEAVPLLPGRVLEYPACGKKPAEILADLAP